jgi:hypothetical protein
MLPNGSLRIYNKRNIQKRCQDVPEGFTGAAMAEIVLSLLLSLNSPPVFTACREALQQVIWPMEKGTMQWTIPMPINGKFYNHQMRSSKTTRGAETNIYERIEK